MINSISNIPDFDEKVSQSFSIVKHALEAAHQMGKTQLQTVEIRKALDSTDYDLCFNTAQKILKKHRRMLNFYTPLTGVSMINATLEEAHSYSINYWKDALKYVEMLIYVNVAIQSGLKSTIEDKLKKIFLSENKAISY